MAWKIYVKEKSNPSVNARKEIEVFCKKMLPQPVFNPITKFQADSES